ncbi:SOS response-associated peptidase [Bosea sp. UNC402CLCol]|uniref:SOS response-associated peptidase n=1 Tax=Bosea sp. UNC402CLCol TaxID=1510531 RepID=UPI0005710CA9|nr:SOS response-associated peptidase [Bosea sp. UNC402CLCol]
MCGRFSQAYSWGEIVAFSQPLTNKLPAEKGNLQPRYNIAPTTLIHIIVKGETGRELREARWGLIPGWHKGGLKDFKLSTFNAKVETVDTSGTFKHAYKSRRCIIPASGFFEWTGEKKDRVPHFFSAADGDLLAFAGLYERFRDPESGEEITTCTMIVREANAWTAQYHDRMPCMLLKQDFDAWLDGSGGMELLKQPPRELGEWIVSKRVNKAGEGDDDPRTIEPFKDDLF